MSELFSHAGVVLAERALVPDALIRWGIRRFCAARLRQERNATRRHSAERLVDLVSGPVAIEQDAANEQHYEVPAGFYRLVLGRHLKYSCGWWSEIERAEGSRQVAADLTQIDRSEADMLELTCDRAMLEDGQRILELGCGWGSLTLWMARQLPHARIVAVSNSSSQRQFIEAQCLDRGLANVEVLTADVAKLDLSTLGRFDRMVSVEMFEHMRNWNVLFDRVAAALVEDGRAFLHVFCHREFAYPYETEGASNWMGRTFFSGGLMPSFDLVARVGGDLEVEKQWRVDGRHYEATSNAWLRRLDQRHQEAESLFREVYGARDAARWVQRWRLFFMACAELFGYDGGREWMVTHLRLRPPA